MNEAETRAEHIDPALKAAGWGVVEGSGNDKKEINQLGDKSIQDVGLLIDGSLKHLRGWPFSRQGSLL